ncbi:head-tail connector protein [Brochothrix thermosphacta]|uniref:head-tail connector protein n=1 Tax=Brochothrix thermosphacta TaxID=2756 RepID=UPI001C4ED15E|nr:head-tail connector protein [Brochothrix thermosphacta]
MKFRVVGNSIALFFKKELITIVDIKTIKNALRIDHDYDDELLSDIYIPAAEIDIQTSITSNSDDSFFNDNKLYNLAVIILTNHFYEYHSIQTLDNVKDVNHSLSTLLQKLDGDYRLWAMNQQN